MYALRYAHTQARTNVSVRTNTHTQTRSPPLKHNILYMSFMHITSVHTRIHMRKYIIPALPTTTHFLTWLIAIPSVHGNIVGKKKVCMNIISFSPKKFGRLSVLMQSML